MYNIKTLNKISPVGIDYFDKNNYTVADDCENPDAICIASGGKGSDEDISESECMKRTLIEKGADPSRIIMEDTSTTTIENIRNTFAITDAMGYGRDITIVTDGFHQFRASMIAKQCGAGEVSAISANTEIRFIPTYWVREWIAIVWVKLSM